MRGRAILGLVLAMLVSPALAEGDAPSSRDVTAIQKCIRAKTGRSWAWENCIGIVSEPCSRDESSIPPAKVIACYGRERLVWDNILNDSFRRLREKLDDAQKVKMREMQQAWIASRDKTCNFFYDYYEGSMANPMIAACEARETGRRALFLLGFVNDSEGK